MKYQVQLNTGGSTYILAEYDTEQEAIEVMDEVCVDKLTSGNIFIRVTPIDSSRPKYINASLVLEAVVQEAPEPEDLVVEPPVNGDANNEPPTDILDEENDA